MKRCTSWGIVVLAAVCLGALPALAGDEAGAANSRFTEALANFPMAFEANRGQTDPSVLFQARGKGYGLYLLPDGAVLGLSRSPQDGTALLRMKIVGANGLTAVSGLDPLPGQVNYFVGKDPSKWRTNVPTYGSVRYKDVYPGIDVLFYGKGRQLEFDFIVKPGADPSRIRLDFKGSERISLSPEGDLVIRIPGGEVVHRKPVVYQDTPEGRKTLEGAFRLKGSRQVQFDVPRYDRLRPLTIDPVLTYSSYLGGGGVEESWGIAVDSTGAAYVAGYTNSNPFPTTAGAYDTSFNGGAYDAFVTKINAAGTALVFSTYLGGSGEDRARAVALDASNNVYVTGHTDSGDFPIYVASGTPLQGTLGGGWDAFVTKVAAAGNALAYSTYLGGTSVDAGYGIAVTGTSAVVTGNTASVDFPLAYPLVPANQGATDAFVTRVNPTGTYPPDFSTYLGGTGSEYPQAAFVDAAGAVYITGYTNSGNYPTVSAFQGALSGPQDAFLTKLNWAAGTHTLNYGYSTYLGGSGTDWSYGLRVDGTGSAYVSGCTGSTDFPTQAPFQPANAGLWDGFVTKFSPSGTTLVYSTYLGGTADDASLGLAVDGTGAATAVGWTASFDFPISNPIAGAAGAGVDVFATKLNAAGSLMNYSVYLGGAGTDYAQDVALDGSGNARITGHTSSNADFPTTAGVFQPAYGGGGEDAFAIRLGPVAAGVCNITTCGASAPASGAVGYPISFTATVTSTNCTLAYYWSFGDGFTATTLNTTHIYAAAGTYTWYFVTTDVGGNWCYQQGVITIGPCTLTCGAATVPAAGSTGEVITFDTADATPSGSCSGTVTYTWAFGDGGTATGTTVTHTYAAPGTYAWTMTARVDAMTTCTTSGSITIALGCEITCAATVPASGVATVAIPFAATATLNPVCVGSPSYAWTFGDGGSAAAQNTTHSYASGGTYTWTLTVTSGTTVCTQTGTITITGTAISCSATVPGTVLVDTPVSFVGSASVTSCVGTPIYAWTFGDGGTSSLLSATHTYTSTGTFTWTFTVTCGGETCTRTGLINVCSLTCSASAQPTQGYAPLYVLFDALMQPGCAGYVNYNWDFGDGSPHGLLREVAHTYTIGGTYVWTMTATVNGLSCTKTGTISVCSLTCTATVPTTGKAGVPVSFTSTSMISYCRGTPEYLWTFGDGGTSFLQSPTHTYVNGGTYTWTLTVREAGGVCTRTGTIVVSNPPIVTQMKAKDDPEFNIVAKGRNLQPGVSVYINGTWWPSVTWKSTYKVRLNGGPALKAVAPPNIPLQFTFVNPDGASWTVIWQYPL